LRTYYNTISSLQGAFATRWCSVRVESDEDARYYEELPVDYVLENEFSSGEGCFTVTLEYGPDHDQFDPFDVAVGRISQGDAEHSDKGRYLHPVVRRYQGGTLAAEHHVTENLENDWTWPSHRDPLYAFFAREIGSTAMAVPSEV
jgi:hypothetical protein